MKGAAGAATYFVFPSAQAIDTQPGMKPGSRVNQRPTSRKKQSRTLISAKERGPSFLYSARSTSWADFSSPFFSRLQPQDRLEEAKTTGGACRLAPGLAEWKCEHQAAECDGKPQRAARHQGALSKSLPTPHLCHLPARLLRT